MRRAGLKITESRIADHDDKAKMSEALTRLYRAASQGVSEIVADLSASERAKLAVFCYGRVHLNAVGLAIAATCDLDHLVVAAQSSTAGRTIFTQSRETTSVDKPLPGRRAPVSLATSASRGTPLQALYLQPDLPAELPA
jgi:hypothetical protein